MRDGPICPMRALLATLETWLSPYLAGMKRKSDLARIDLANMLRGLVPQSLLSRLEALAPVRMEVPNGAHYRIDYDTDGDPVLRVRLQEMFGHAHVPPKWRMDGRDCASNCCHQQGGLSPSRNRSKHFWVNAYADVRKDLRGRYPKHYWPENPLEAQAVAPRRLRLSNLRGRLRELQVR